MALQHSIKTKRNAFVNTTSIIYCINAALLLRIELLKIEWTEFHFEQKGVFDLFLEEPNRKKQNIKTIGTFATNSRPHTTKYELLLFRNVFWILSFLSLFCCSWWLYKNEINVYVEMHLLHYDLHNMYDSYSTHAASIRNAATSRKLIENRWRPTKRSRANETK